MNRSNPQVHDITFRSLKENMYLNGHFLLSDTGGRENHIVFSPKIPELLTLSAGFRLFLCLQQS